MDIFSSSLRERRKSGSMRSRPVTSYLPDTSSSEFRRHHSTMSFHTFSSRDNTKWQTLCRDQVTESGYLEQQPFDDPVSENATPPSLPSPRNQNRRQPIFPQSFKSGFASLGRRLSSSIRNGKSKIHQEFSDNFKSSSVLHKRRSQCLDNIETTPSRPRTSDFIRSLNGRSRPSFPVLRHSKSHSKALSQIQTHDCSTAGTQINDNVLFAPPLASYVTGGAGARASAAAQNEAMMAMRETPLPTYDAAVSNGSMKDTESGIGISLDGQDAEQPIGHIARCDPIDYLATELLEHIFSYLDAKSLTEVKSVSKRWSEISQSQAVWRKVFYQEYGSGRPSHSSSRSSAPGLGKRNVPGQDYRKLYNVRKKIDKRWEDGEAAAIYLNGHKDSVYCVQFDENKIITGSRDNTIRVWDARTYQCLHKLGPANNLRERVQIQRPEVEPSGVVPFFKCETSSPDPKSTSLSMWHDASVLCLQYDDEILVTGSSDYSCIVWSVKDGYQPMFQLLGHTAGVLDVCIDATRIVTCSKDTTIKIWERATGQLIRTLTGHRGPVNAVQVRGNLLASASGDGVSKLWRLEDGMCIKEFHSKLRGLACVEFSEDGRTIFAGGNDHVIYEYSTITGLIERELQGHSELVRSLHLDSSNGRIVSGSYDSSIKVWDATNGMEHSDGGLKLDLQGWTSSWILAAKSNYRKIACASQDGRVVIVDFGYGIDGVHLVEA